MPSVNLSLLRLQAFELSQRLGDPAAFQKKLRALMEEHAHRLLRRGRSMAQRGALPAWDVPGLLIREMEAALVPAAGKKPDAALAAADAVWSSGRLEEKLLAVFLAGFSREPGEIRSRLLSWLGETDDPAVLQSLAGHACPPLWRSDGLLFRSDVRAWIEDPVPARRRFGWMALRAWVEEKTSESVFAAFDLLPAAFSESDPEAAEAASGLFLRLAEVSPQETQGWISGLSSKSLERGRRFLRRMLGRLPEDTVRFLRDAMQEK
jgi:hypothetical protein